MFGIKCKSFFISEIFGILRLTYTCTQQISDRIQQEFSASENIIFAKGSKFLQYKKNTQGNMCQSGQVRGEN